ncbi:PAP2 family protein [Mycolicibacterium sp. P9-64]|uniref:phosphatase PAP2 family protein n=1 Tax=Mycolicibacterium sp. P9-64 TaxID=2024612 RepID=UPI0011EBD4BA|nr:phosphatase PAP2 family protein [Mycolicibacterium sp. P9-64]KAA0077192.1 PAP2 family protein [Mycolicibacterium sp. P9-64]
MTRSAIPGRIRNNSGRFGPPILWAAALVLVFVDLGVAAHVAAHGTAADHSVLAWMVHHRRGWLTTLAIAITTAGSPVAMGMFAVIVAAVLWRRRSPMEGLIVVGTIAAACGLSTLTKICVGAQRPPRAVQLLLEVDPSYPSGHVTGTLALCGIVAVAYGRGRSSGVRTALACGVLVSTAAVACTRLYLGVHWLTDVTGGLLVGGAAVIVGSVALEAVISSPTAGPGAESPTPTVSRVA